MRRLIFSVARRITEFQFTHPGRGATKTEHTDSIVLGVSIHAPREGCDNPRIRRKEWATRFNSRTPGGVRLEGLTLGETLPQFQFTHPGRGATNCGYPDFGDIPVSIHAPREGCDPIVATLNLSHSLFQFTHPGRGATEADIASTEASTEFQFTHPGRGATGLL